MPARAAATSGASSSRIADVGIGDVAEDGEVDVRIEVAEREHLDVLQQRGHRFRARQHRRDDDHRAGVVRDAIGEVEAGQPPRRNGPCDRVVRERDGDVHRRHEQEQREQRDDGGGSALVPPVGRAGGEQQRRHDRDRAQVDERRVREDEALNPVRETGLVRHVDFEVAPASIDQVVSHVRGPIRGRSGGGRLARAFDRPQSDAHLGVAARRRQLLHGPPLAIAAEKIHLPVRAGRIALQHLFDQAHRLDVLAPVDRRAHAQAGDGVRDRHLRGRLTLMFVANHRLRGRGLRREVRLDRRADRRQTQAVLADAMQKLDDRCDVKARGQRLRRFVPVAFDARHVRVGEEARAAGFERLGGETPEVFDERQLQHAGPRPELADRQRSDALVAVDERRELLAVDPAVTVADQLHGHGVDARIAGVLARGERRQLPVVGAGQVLADVPDFGRHEVEVVEQPLGGGRDRLSRADVVGQRAIRVAQHARVVGEPGKDVAGTAARARIEREARRERQRPLVEPLAAEQFVAERLLLRRPAPEAPEESAHGISKRTTSAGEMSAAVIGSVCDMSPQGRALVRAEGRGRPQGSGKRHGQYTARRPRIRSSDRCILGSSSRTEPACVRVVHPVQSL